MARKLVVAQLPAKSTEVRDEFIQRLSFAADFAQKNEPGIPKYAVFVPRDDANGTTLFAVEEYADEEVFDSHMALPHIKSMLDWIGTGNVLAGAPRILELQYLDGSGFSRKEIAGVEDPYVVIAELDYKPDVVEQSFPYWNGVIETGSEQEPGTLVYGVLKYPKEQTKLFTLEAYENKEYLTDVHAKSKAVEENVKNTKHLRSGLKHNVLKIKGGYLHKEI